MLILKKRDIKDGICIIGEPTNMKIIDAHKGMNEYTVPILISTLSNMS